MSLEENGFIRKIRNRIGGGDNSYSFKNLT